MKLIRGTLLSKSFLALRQSAVAGFSLIFLFGPGISARADNLVQNGSFENTSLTNTDYFTSFSIAYGGTGVSNVANWTVNCAGTLYPPNAGSCAPGDPLLFLIVPNTTPTSFSAGNSLYGPGPDSATTAIPESPDGGNFIAEDGNPVLNTSFSQQISGLSIGTNYILSFYQAASQQQGQMGATTEQWQVSLGGQTQDSTLINNPAQSFTPWTQQTMAFTATSASEALTFLAVGTGAPPIALLDGVTLSTAPEPSSLEFLGVSCAGLLALLAVRRQRQKRA